MYFENFPKIIYGFTIQGKYQQFVLTDITENIRFKKEILADTSLYSTYTIRDGETPEIIAEKLYNDPQLHWLIMLANDKYDYSYAESKYPLNVYGIHHYVNPAGYIVSSDVAGAVSVSNIDYETQLNESKRQIRVINSNYIPKILEQFNDLI